MRANSSGIRAKRHRKILKKTKGFRGLRNRLFKQAKTALMRAGRHAYVGRRQKKRDFRKLWIIRIKAFLNLRGASYSNFIASLKKSNIEIDRKILADLAVRKPEVLEKVVEASNPELFSKMLQAAKVEK